MDCISSELTETSSSSDGRTDYRRTAYVAVLLLVIVGALISYKTTTALAVLQIDASVET